MEGKRKGRPLTLRQIQSHKDGNTLSPVGIKRGWGWRNKWRYIISFCFSLLNPADFAVFLSINQFKKCVMFAFYQAWFWYLESLQMLRCPCYWRWGPGRKQHPETNMVSLRMSYQPQWQFLDHSSKRRDQRKACLGLSKAFDKVRGTTGKFLASMYTKKRWNSFATSRGDFHTNSLHPQPCIKEKNESFILPLQQE